MLVPEATTPVTRTYAGRPSAGRVCAPGAAGRALKSPGLPLVPPACAVLGRVPRYYERRDIQYPRLGMLKPAVPSSLHSRSGIRSGISCSSLLLSASGANFP